MLLKREELINKPHTHPKVSTRGQRYCNSRHLFLATRCSPSIFAFDHLCGRGWDGKRKESSSLTSAEGEPHARGWTSHRGGERSYRGSLTLGPLGTRSLNKTRNKRGRNGFRLSQHHPPRLRPPFPFPRYPPGPLRSELHPNNTRNVPPRRLQQPPPLRGQVSHLHLLGLLLGALWTPLNAARRGHESVLRGRAASRAPGTAARDRGSRDLSPPLCLQASFLRHACTSQSP